jgi:hypothetical protein
MIDKTGREYLLDVYDVSCDKTGCSFAEEFKSEDWGDLLDQMGDAGWHKQTSGGMWAHICPACAEDM